ncbi:hypothetical protein ABEB36_007494 [Hypothenemus hampei]|uniref:Glutathione transferase n=1 Tax=Hypothenemus hampei TaxID=57062 RepID=A0ABD1EU61_HYPHA
MSPKLYIFSLSPPSRAVLMIAKAIGLELDVEIVERENLRTEEMLQLNPQHTVPILVDPEENFTIWDSHAIAVYLVGQYAEDDSLYQKNDPKKTAVINQRFQFDSVLFEKCKAAFLPVIMGVQDDISEEARDNIIETLGFLEIFLKDKAWVAGDDMTVADLSILAIVSTINDALFPIDPERFPNIIEWYGRGKELPYFEECNKEANERFKELIKHEIPLL